jgi:hypothetical protein
MSVALRPFETVKKWTYLLFEEFFAQGDLEQAQDMPISFLCDRKTTVVKNTQPFFVKNIVMPLFIAITDILPAMQVAIDACNQTASAWE